MTTFLRLLDVPVDEKEQSLRQAIKGMGMRWFEADPITFAQVPGSPFAYWASEQVRRVFSTMADMTDRGAQTKCGLGTLDDFRFVRAWWEAPSSRKWTPFPKGGLFSTWYSAIPLVLCWESDGIELKVFVESKVGSASRKIQAQDFYFRPGLTWPRRTQSGLGMRAMPAGCIFADKGPAAFVEGDDPDDLLALLGLSTSASFRYLVELQMAFGSYEVGVIQRTPVPEFSNEAHQTLARHTRRAWSLKHTLDTTNETSHAFLLPALLRSRLGPYDPRAIEAELTEIQRTIDDLAFDAYAFAGDDRKAIEAWASSKPASAINDATETEGEAEADEDAADTLLADAIPALYSWAIGVAFGRFDIRLVTGERQAPPEPVPFDPLPARSPGMIPEADEAHFPPRSLLVDDPGHTLDLAAQAGNLLERVGFAPENPESLRRWLAREFFPLHIKMYSKSRRKAPIYWQLATPSASYSVWLYIHAFNRDTLYQVQEIAELKLRHEERKLESLRADSGASPTVAQRKVLESQESFVEELRAFLEEVKRVAPLWNPNLDDGVIINFAPLWRLVPHHKPWQKELKATWDALCAEEYDWAHLAMHLWPERVVPKCATDRSLAIAHGLEDVFWMEGEDGKWKPRPVPTRPVAELVSERTSQTVKAALKSLLEAPVAPSGGGRGRPRRGSKAGGGATI